MDKIIENGYCNMCKLQLNNPGNCEECGNKDREYYKINGLCSICETQLNNKNRCDDCDSEDEDDNKMDV
jgi:predicted amidophosphoribosyltransferase